MRWAGVNSAPRNARLCDADVNIFWQFKTLNCRFKFPVKVEKSPQTLSVWSGLAWPSCLSSSVHKSGRTLRFCSFSVNCGTLAPACVDSPGSFFGSTSWTSSHAFPGSVFGVRQIKVGARGMMISAFFASGSRPPAMLWQHRGTRNSLSLSLRLNRPIYTLTSTSGHSTRGKRGRCTQKTFPPLIIFVCVPPFHPNKTLGQDVQTFRCRIQNKLQKKTREAREWTAGWGVCECVFSDMTLWGLVHVYSQFCEDVSSKRPTLGETLTFSMWAERRPTETAAEHSGLLVPSWRTRSLKPSTVGAEQPLRGSASFDLLLGCRHLKLSLKRRKRYVFFKTSLAI